MAVLVLTAAVTGCGSEETAVDAPNDSGAGVTFPLRGPERLRPRGCGRGRYAARFEAHSDPSRRHRQGQPLAGAAPRRVAAGWLQSAHPARRRSWGHQGEEGGGEVELGLPGLLKGDYAVAVRSSRAKHRAVRIALGRSSIEAVRGFWVARRWGPSPKGRPQRHDPAGVVADDPRGGHLNTRARVWGVGLCGMMVDREGPRPSRPHPERPPSQDAVLWSGPSLY